MIPQKLYVYPLTLFVSKVTLVNPEVRAKMRPHQPYRKTFRGADITFDNYGYILIRHGVLRRIEPRWFFRFQPPSPVLAYFHDKPPCDAFGRMGTIFFEGKSAVELLEIVSR